MVSLFQQSNQMVPECGELSLTDDSWLILRHQLHEELSCSFYFFLHVV